MDHDPPPDRAGGQAGERTALPSGEVTDAELIRRCRAGDQHAWTRLIQRYERLVYSVPRRLGMSQEIVDETFQEVWTVLLRRLGSLQHEQALPQWLITTARRIALRAAQRARRLDARRSDELPEQAERGAGPSIDGEQTFVERAERARQVADAMDRLDPACRELLMALTRSDETSYAQISRQLGMPIGSIGPKRARCLERLLQYLPAGLRAEYRIPGQGDAG